MCECKRPRPGLQLLGTQDQIAEGRVAIETAVSCSHSAKMSVTQHNRLEATADKAQSLIFELMGEKIRDLVGSASFIDWTPSELAPAPHPYVEDLISYLQVGVSPHFAARKSLSAYCAARSH